MPKMAKLVIKVLRLRISQTKKCFVRLVKHEIKWVEYFNDIRRFIVVSNNNGGTRFQNIALKPCLEDKSSSLNIDRHYFYHPAWACRVLAKTLPTKHIDISSIVSFAGNVSAFVPTEYYEFQAPHIGLDNLKAGSIDLSALPWKDKSVESLSCMHVVEHVGLGRYGDNIDRTGDIGAMRELQRVLAPGGNLLFVVPVSDRSRIEFNAHRIYSPSMIVKEFEELELIEFAIIPDKAAAGGLVRDAGLSAVRKQDYACGCFHFIRPGSAK